MSVHTTSSQSAALVEFDVSTGFIPPWLLQAREEAAPTPYQEKQNKLPKRYRDLVTAHVYTLPSQEGARVHLHTPTRPSTGRAPSFLPQEKSNRRARSARLLKSTAKVPREASTLRRCPVPRKLNTSRQVKSAPGVRNPPRLSGETMGEPVVTSGVIEETLADGVHPGVDKYRWRYSCRRTVHTASGRIGRWVGRSSCLASAALQADSVRRLSDRKRSTVAPRALSAPARGVTTRRAVGGCNDSPPPVSGVSRGARRFIEHWDRSSRAERDRILLALTKKLLFVAEEVRRAGLGSTRRPGIVQNGSLENSYNRASTEDYDHRQKAYLADSSNRIDLHPFPLTRPNQRLPSGTHRASFRSTRQTDAIVSAAADDVTTKHNVKDSRIARPSFPGVLELLGPHAGLFVTRIYSYLQSSYVCGRDIGPCLRVAALLAGSTVNTTPGSTGGEVASYLESHLSTSRNIVQISLDIIVAEDKLHDGSGTATVSTQEGSRIDALNLLFAIVRAGGRCIKEALTRRHTLPRSGARNYRDDAVSSTLIALRKRTCSAETRTAAGRLLVELGTENPIGSAQVWNAVLCLLEQEERSDLQILGCRVAADLLVTAQSRSSDEVYYGNAHSCSSSTPRRPRSTMRPEHVVIPSVLRLALLGSCSAVRAAARDLAAVMKTQQGPCFYLLVVGLVGFLGRFSGVDRGAPSSWIPHNMPMTSERSMSAINGGGVRGNGDGNPCGLLRKRRFSHDEEDSSTIRAGTHPFAIDNNSSKTGRSIDGVSLTIDREFGGRIGIDVEKNVTKDLIEGIEQQARPWQNMADESVDLLICALELLRRICTGRGQDEVVSMALVSTRAPLAVLDLVVASAPRAADVSLLETAKETEPPLLRFSGGRNTFVTHTGGLVGAEKCRFKAGHLSNSTRRRDINPNNSEIPCGSSATPTLPRRLCHAVAKVLLEMYRRGGGLIIGAHPNNGNIPVGFSGQGGSSSDDFEKLPTDHEALNLVGIIDAAMKDCTRLSCNLKNGDFEGLAAFFSGRFDGADCRAEIELLRRNIFALTRHLGKVRPPSPTSSAIVSPQKGEVTQHWISNERNAAGQRSGGRNVAESCRPSNREGIRVACWRHDEASEKIAHRGRNLLRTFLPQYTIIYISMDNIPNHGSLFTPQKYENNRIDANSWGKTLFIYRNSYGKGFLVYACSHAYDRTMNYIV